MNGLWDQSGIPHKGWSCLSVEDLEEAIGTCEICGQEQIRFVHHMEHPDYENSLGVGCVCAEKMTDDYVNPKQREHVLKNRASQRLRWLKRKWRISSRGNSYLNIKGYNIVIFQNKKGCKIGKWSYKIDEKFGSASYTTEDEVKLAAFDEYYEIIKAG